MAHNAALLRRALALLTFTWGTAPMVDPAAPCASAVMAAVALPAVAGLEAGAGGAVRLHDWLRRCQGIEVPVIAYGGTLWVRISAQVTLVRHQRCGGTVGLISFHFCGVCVF